MDVIDLTDTSLCLNKKPKKTAGWVSPSFMDIGFPVKETPNQKKRKFPRHKSYEVTTKSPVCSNETWLQKYAPSNEDSLAVHKKKVSEVDSWLTSHLNSKKGAPILLLNGPPGCGKTTTLLVLAKKHGIQVEEWANPLTTPYSVTRLVGIKYEPQNALFEEFLFRSGKYPSLLVGEHKKCDTDIRNKLVLLEELPLHIYQDPSVLKDILRKYKLTQRRPLVLILSDGSSTDAVKRQLISREFQQQAGVTNISFNAVSATLMSKTLLHIAKNERRHLSKEDISALSTSCGGDIRAAINALQFSSQSESLTSRVATRKRAGKSSSSCLGGKDTNLILFRALGKILYCKRDAAIKSDKSDLNHRDPLSYPPEDVIEQCCLSGRAFGLFLHHNYLPFYDNNTVDDLSMASDFFSLSDLMNSPLTSSDPSSGAGAALDRYEGLLAARGLIFSNRQRATADLCLKATGSWRPLHKPSWYQVSKCHLENFVNVSSTFWKLRQPPQELLCTTLPYLLKLRSRFPCDAAQRMLLDEVVALPKWKLFRSGQDDRITEQLAGDDSTQPESSEETSCAKIAEGPVENDDETLEIEEFSD